MRTRARTVSRPPGHARSPASIMVCTLGLAGTSVPPSACMPKSSTSVEHDASRLSSAVSANVSLAEAGSVSHVIAKSSSTGCRKSATPTSSSSVWYSSWYPSGSGSPLDGSTSFDTKRSVLVSVASGNGRLGSRRIDTYTLPLGVALERHGMGKINSSSRPASISPPTTTTTSSSTISASVFVTLYCRTMCSANTCLYAVTMYSVSHSVSCTGALTGEVVRSLPYDANSVILASSVA